MHRIKITEKFHFLYLMYLLWGLLGEIKLTKKLKRSLGKHNTDTCFQSVRPLGSFLNSGKDLTRGDLVSGVYKIPCSCGKFYIGRTHQQFIERFIEHRNSIEKTLQLRKPPETFVSALAEHTFFLSRTFDEATAISSDRGFSQWAREAIEIKKHIFANISINRDTGNLNIDPIYDILLKNEPIVDGGIKILHNHQGTRLPTRPKRVASMLAHKRIISQQIN